ncbi:MAG: hypothetical protein DAHOPDDO_01900 [Ignavibacteriaceae bacterium]|nr:hypothetical protein [Ignavibacteriaceae bacterium]NUM60655.1 hypothetical protein [Ignavibacteriaceae bacterium]
MSIFKLAMSLIYVGAGMFLILGKNIFSFTDFQKIGLGVILIAYGTFRTYSSIKKLSRKEEENES